MRSSLLILISLSLLLNLAGWRCLAQKPKEEKFDVLVYGATPSGVASAISAARMGMKVALVDESGRLSGESFLPNYSAGLNFMQPFYKEILTKNPDPVLDSTEFWPEKGLRVVEQMLNEEPTIHFFEGWKWDFENVRKRDQKPELLHLVRIRNEKRGAWISANIYIDASNEGALASWFGVDFLKPEKRVLCPEDDSTSGAYNRIRGWYIFNRLDQIFNQTNLETTIAAIQFNYNPKLVPFCIPFGVMLPTKTENLLVPNCVSSTSQTPFHNLHHLRSQFALGHTAGVAAALSIRLKTSPAKLKMDSLQTHLIRQKAILVYVADVLPDHPDFEWVQKIAILGWIPENKARLDEKMSPEDIQHIATRTGFSEKEITEMAEAKTDRRAALYIIWKVYEREKWLNDPQANPTHLKE